MSDFGRNLALRILRIEPIFQILRVLTCFLPQKRHSSPQIALFCGHAEYAKLPPSGTQPEGRRWATAIQRVWNWCGTHAKLAGTGAELGRNRAAIDTETPTNFLPTAPKNHPNHLPIHHLPPHTPRVCAVRLMAGVVRLFARRGRIKGGPSRLNGGPWVPHGRLQAWKPAPQYKKGRPARIGPLDSSFDRRCHRRLYRVSRGATYLINNISRYVGSGQRSSATIVSNLSPSTRTANIAGMIVSFEYLA